MHNEREENEAQATSYLLSAWEALAVHKQKPTKDLPVVFEDVQIYQAVQADVQVPVTFKVSLDHSNRFQVCTSHAPICQKKQMMLGACYCVDPNICELLKHFEIL